jgi:Flp pilus assembly protein TadG
MRAKKKHSLSNKGQAAIEMALSMPFLIWLLYYTINAFYSIHTSHVAQKYAAMNVWQRVNNRSKFIVDDVARQVVPRSFIAVRYTDEEGNIPRRKILVGPNQVNNIVGICREPDCN